METYKTDIIATRMGGLGSSDAKMVAKIGKSQSLSYADRERIAQMKGLAERRQFTTAATENGDYIEQRIYESVKLIYPEAVSNPFYKSGKLSDKYGFDIFCHIDIEAVSGDDLYWIECKATKADTAHTYDTYMHQLEWEHMLLEERAKELGKTPHLMLSHYHVTELGEYDTDNLTNREIEPAPFIRKDIKAGLKHIASILPSFTWEPKQELEASDLPEQQRGALAKWLARQQKMKEWLDEDRQIKDGLFDMMAAMDVKSIRIDGAVFTIKEGYTTTKIDSKKVQKLHPEVFEECKMTSEIKPTLQVKLTH